MGHGAENCKEDILGCELAGDWKCGTRDTNLSNREMVLKKRIKLYHQVSQSQHISLAVSIKINRRRILSMNPDTLLIEASLMACNLGVQSSGTLGDLLRFQSWKRHWLKEKGGPGPVLTTLRTYYAGLL